jgi:hypothetical protein
MAAHQESLSPALGDECWFTKSMARVTVSGIHPDGTYTVTKANGKELYATCAGLLSIVAFAPV